MPREKADYRDNFEALREFFPSQMLLSARDVATYCGCDPRTAQKRYAIGREGITIPSLARKMCQ